MSLQEAIALDFGTFCRAVTTSNGESFVPSPVADTASTAPEATVRASLVSSATTTTATTANAAANFDAMCAQWERLELGYNAYACDSPFARLELMQELYQGALLLMSADRPALTRLCGVFALHALHCTPPRVTIRVPQRLWPNVLAGISAGTELDQKWPAAVLHAMLTTGKIALTSHVHTRPRLLEDATSAPTLLWSAAATPLDEARTESEPMAESFQLELKKADADYAAAKTALFPGTRGLPMHMKSVRSGQLQGHLQLLRAGFTNNRTDRLRIYLRALCDRERQRNDSSSSSSTTNTGSNSNSRVVSSGGNRNITDGVGSVSVVAVSSVTQPQLEPQSQPLVELRRKARTTTTTTTAPTTTDVALGTAGDQPAAAATTTTRTLPTSNGGGSGRNSSRRSRVGGMPQVHQAQTAVSATRHKLKRKRTVRSGRPVGTTGRS